jgi:hypothetical protein
MRRTQKRLPHATAYSRELRLEPAQLRTVRGCSPRSGKRTSDGVAAGRRRLTVLRLFLASALMSIIGGRQMTRMGICSVWIAATTQTRSTWTPPLVGLERRGGRIRFDHPRSPSRRPSVRRSGCGATTSFPNRPVQVALTQKPMLNSIICFIRSRWPAHCAGVDFDPLQSQ